MKRIYFWLEANKSDRFQKKLISCVNRRQEKRNKYKLEYKQIIE